ncbi:MAG: polysaccharide deacetylase family protein [Candidatus Limnocylindrales bacterium]
MTTRTTRLSTLLLACLLVSACVPDPVGRPRPAPLTPGPSLAPSASAVPSGPTPRPSFVRPTPLPSPTFFVYVVRSGDSLSSIARSYSTTPFSLAVWNRETYPSLDPESEGYDPNRIVVGWMLRLIPDAEVNEEDLLEPTPAPSPSGGPASPGATASPVTAPPASPAPSIGGASVVVRHGDRSVRTVALTFDMGGRLEPALDIVDWLVANDVPATIFPTGRTATQTSEGQAVMEAIGTHRDHFDLGNHSWSHPDFRNLDAPAIRDQLARTEAAIVAAINVSTRPWFRPPFGGLDDQIPAVVGAAGYGYTVMWDIDTIDWRPVADGGPTAQQIVDKVVSRADGGSIVLMHLGGFNTLEALPGIVAGLRAKGLTPVTLGTMLGG